MLDKGAKRKVTELNTYLFFLVLPFSAWLLV